MHNFIATLVFARWHNLSLQKLIKNTPKALVMFTSFIEKIAITTNLPEPCLILALYFIHAFKNKRLIVAGPGSEVRIFTAAYSLAMKTLVDQSYTNLSWSQITRIPVVELNSAEIELCFALDWRLNLGQDEYRVFLDDVRVAQCKFNEICCGLTIDDGPRGKRYSILNYQGQQGNRPRKQDLFARNSSNSDSKESEHSRGRRAQRRISVS